MNPRVRVLSVVFLLILVTGCTRAAANELTLNFQGITDDSSLGRVEFDTGTYFHIQATFNTSSAFDTTTGYASYVIDSLQAEVNTDWYTATSTAGIFVDLSDSSYTLTNPYYVPAIYNTNTPSAIAPAYLGTTPVGWSATNPTPVVFNNFIVSLNPYSNLDFSTASGTLTLDYDEGVDAWITGASVPEGNTFTLFLMGLTAIGAGRWMGRRCTN